MGFLRLPFYQLNDVTDSRLEVSTECLNVFTQKSHFRNAAELSRWAILVLVGRAGFMEPVCRRGTTPRTGYYATGD